MPPSPGFAAHRVPMAVEQHLVLDVRMTMHHLPVIRRLRQIHSAQLPNIPVEYSQIGGIAGLQPGRCPLLACSDRS